MRFESQDDAFEALGAPRDTSRVMKCHACGFDNAGHVLRCVMCHESQSVDARTDEALDPRASPYFKRDYQIRAYYRGGIGSHNRYVGRTSRANAQTGLSVAAWCAFAVAIVAMFLSSATVAWSALAVAVLLQTGVGMWIWDEVLHVDTDSEGRELR